MRALVMRAVLFIVLAGGGMGLTLFVGLYQLRPPLVGATARVTAFLLSMCGGAAHAEGPLVLSNYGDVLIIYECTGILPMVILTSAVLSFPARWQTKLLGAGVGLVGMFALNQIRILSLFFMGFVATRSTTDTAHHLIWPALISMSTVFFFVRWAKRARCGYQENGAR